MDDEGTMTLAFELAALKRLADPSAVYAETQGWSDYFGVVSDRPAYVVNKYTRDKLIQHDFEPGPDGMYSTLEDMRTHFETDRYVFVGTDEADRDRAESVGWEFLPLEQAAEAADWTLSSEPDDEPVATVEDVREDWP